MANKLQKILNTIKEGLYSKRQDTNIEEEIFSLIDVVNTMAGGGASAIPFPQDMYEWEGSYTTAEFCNKLKTNHADLAVQGAVFVGYGIFHPSDAPNPVGQGGELKLFILADDCYILDLYSNNSFPYHYSCRCDYSESTFSINNGIWIPDIIQIQDTNNIPVASQELAALNVTFQYTGGSVGGYEQGHFYKCTINTSTTPVFFEWVEIDVQDALKNTATGSYSLTIEGTASPTNSSTNVGANSAAYGWGASAFGCDAKVGTDEARVPGAIQLGKGQNDEAGSMKVGLSSNGSSWNNYKLLDSEGKIPTDRLTLSQTSGQATNETMSQKAITDLVASGSGGGITVTQTTGQSTTQVMSQKAVTDELATKVGATVTGSVLEFQ